MRGEEWATNQESIFVRIPQKEEAPEGGMPRFVLGVGVELRLLSGL